MLAATLPFIFYYYKQKKAKKRKGEQSEISETKNALFAAFVTKKFRPPKNISFSYSVFYATKIRRPVKLSTRIFVDLVQQF
jgi:hypothetical protein